MADALPTDPSVIRSYAVDTAAFYDRFCGPESHSARIKEAIGELIDRYHLRGLDIFGIGSGASQEEFWLWKLGGNRLTIADIDEHGGIEPSLKVLPPGDLNFHVGDAERFLAGNPTAKYDCIYVSGLTPDEKRRYAILWGPTPPTLLKRIFRRWPKSVDPFHPLVMAAARHLRPGGLLIVQSYAFGINAQRNRNFLPAAARQLSENGMTLIEAHSWVPYRSINLFVGRMNGGPALDLGPALTTFHGRGEPKQPIERTWPR